MGGTLSGFAYLAASVLFILALRGLSSPETARQGNLLGIAGMVVAIGTTLAKPEVLSYSAILWRRADSNRQPSILREPTICGPLKNRRIRNELGVYVLYR